MKELIIIDTNVTSPKQEISANKMTRMLFCFTVIFALTLTFVMSVCDVAADLTEADCRLCHDDPDIIGPTSNVDRHHLNDGTPIPVGDCLETLNVCQLDSDCYDFCDLDPATACTVDADCAGGATGPCVIGENYCIGDSLAPNATLTSPASGLYECLTCHTLVWETNEFAPFRDCMLCHICDGVGGTEEFNNGIDDDCDPSTPVPLVSGVGMNTPSAAKWRASMAVNVNGSGPSGMLRYYYTRQRVSFQSTAINSVIVSGGTAIISGEGNGTRITGNSTDYCNGCNFTVRIDDGSPDRMDIVIDSGDFFTSPGSLLELDSGNFTIVGE